MAGAARRTSITKSRAVQGVRIGGCRAETRLDGTGGRILDEAGRQARPAEMDYNRLKLARYVTNNAGRVGKQCR
jgi:hypothetical protein